MFAEAVSGGTRWSVDVNRFSALLCLFSFCGFGATGTELRGNF